MSNNLPAHLIRASLVSAIEQINMTGNMDLSPLPVYACTVAYNLDALVDAMPAEDRGALVVARWDGTEADALIRRHHSLTEEGTFKTFQNWLPWYDCFQNSKRDDTVSALRFGALQRELRYPEWHPVY